MLSAYYYKYVDNTYKISSYFILALSSLRNTFCETVTLVSEVLLNETSGKNDCSVQVSITVLTSFPPCVTSA